VKSKIELFSDYVALAYHEARNVRHLVKKGYFEKGQYRLLIDGLPNERVEAWKRLYPLRRQAASAADARKAADVFCRAFGHSLEDFVVLSKDSHWSGTRKGGNRWAEIDQALVELRDAMSRCDDEGVAELLSQIPKMPHNTGYLGEKLEMLENKCAQN
jgi:hypothetical protein